MLKTAIDAGERLIGRRFVFVGFVPSLLLLLAVFAVFSGLQIITGPLQQLADGAWSKAATAIVVAVGGSLLLAFVIIGSLGGIRALYVGEWPRRTLRGWLGRRLLVPKLQAFDQLMENEDRLKRALNDAAWPTLLNFEPSGDVLSLNGVDVKTQVALTDDKRRALIQRLKTDRKTTSLDRDYTHILAMARALQATQADFPSQFDSDATTWLNNLIEALRTDYVGNRTLQITTERAYEDAEREYRRAYNERVLNFPMERMWVRPTHLGNITRAIEMYPIPRYGIDWDAMWPRLMFVLPQAARRQIDGATMMVDFALVMSFLSWLFVLAPLIDIPFAMGRAPVIQVLLLTAIELVVSCIAGWAFLQVAIQATISLGEQTQAALDLYRLQLIDALQIVRPRTPTEEREIWEHLRDFIATETPLPSTIRFVAAARKASETTRRSNDQQRGREASTRDHDEEDGADEDTLENDDGDAAIDESGNDAPEETAVAGAADIDPRGADEC